MLSLDGSLGEGGGQILRTALALSLVTATPFRIERIRAGRKKPGLMRQHLAAVEAAARIGSAEVNGCVQGSTTLSFAPEATRPGDYRFSIGTAGSCCLVLQTVLPALLLAGGDSELVLEGGTHNPFAPPFDFLDRAFLPLVNRMGPEVTARLVRPGFDPAGGGEMRVFVRPAGALRRLDLLDRGPVSSCRARAVVARLPRHIADRELKVIGQRMSWGRDALHAEEETRSAGPGNVVSIEIESANVTEVFTGFGERGVPAETVAGRVADEAGEYLAAGAPVGRHLADQLLIPIALAGGGVFRTLAPSAHTTTNKEIVGAFLSARIEISDLGRGVWEIGVG